jgi:hypothetical protein
VKELVDLFPEAAIAAIDGGRVNAHLLVREGALERSGQATS